MPLGLLVDLSKGKISDEMKPAIVLSDKLKQGLQQMLSEHQQIVASLEKLKKAANEENYPDVLQFTETLKLHAQTEEQVLYPTAILIGEYLKLKL
jgi:hemerythrin-like domain-containing protein